MFQHIRVFWCVGFFSATPDTEWSGGARGPCLCRDVHGTVGNHRGFPPAESNEQATWLEVSELSFEIFCHQMTFWRDCCLFVFSTSFSFKLKQRKLIYSVFLVWTMLSQATGYCWVFEAFQSPLIFKTKRSGSVGPMWQGFSTSSCFCQIGFWQMSEGRGFLTICVYLELLTLVCPVNTRLLESPFHSHSCRKWSIIFMTAWYDLVQFQQISTGSTHNMISGHASRF